MLDGPVFSDIGLECGSPSATCPLVQNLLCTSTTSSTQIRIDHASTTVSHTSMSLITRDSVWLYEPARFTRTFHQLVGVRPAEDGDGHYMTRLSERKFRVPIFQIGVRFGPSALRLILCKNQQDQSKICMRITAQSLVVTRSS